MIQSWLTAKLADHVAFDDGDLPGLSIMAACSNIFTAFCAFFPPPPISPLRSTKKTFGKLFWCGFMLN